MDIHITNNVSAQRFEAASGSLVAFLKYKLSGQIMTLVHTEVPAELEGKGLGGQLVKSSLEHARKNNLRIAVRCPFAQSYVKRHKEYSDLLEE